MKIAYIHPDTEDREEEIRQGLYPKNQLWGAGLLRQDGHEILSVPTKCHSPMVRLGQWLNKLTGHRFCDFHIEFQVLALARDVDLVYAPSGHFLILPALRRLGLFRPKVVTWFFRLPDTNPWWNPRNLRFSRYVLNGFDGLLCLTGNSTRDFKARTDDIPVDTIPWYADPDIFNPDVPVMGEGDYFLAVGKTRRDYPTLLTACAKVDAKFRIIAPKESAGSVPVPPNVEFVETSSNPPDAAISYSELRDWYAGAKAVLLPLSGDPEDTSGYTSLLEAIQMGKPVLMTRSGCLDVDVEELGIGKCVPPRDVGAWIRELKDWEGTGQLPNLDFRKAQEAFNSRNFGRQLQKFLTNL